VQEIFPSASHGDVAGSQDRRIARPCGTLDPHGRNCRAFPAGRSRDAVAA
jgi:hypothetical protein